VSTTNRSPIVTPSTKNKTPLIFGAVVAALLIAGITAVIASKTTTKTETAKLPAVQGVAVTGTAMAALPEAGADPAVGTTAPSITGKSFDGAAVSLPVAGKRTMVVIAAHWCPHCQRELPLLVEWKKSGQVPSDLEVVVLSTSVVAERGNFPPAVWLEGINNPFPVMADDAESTAATALGNDSFPTMVLIDKDGKVVRRMSGEKSLDEVAAFAKA
jgi:cytochrome c biogenesis protein CcmG, thiol:disulfide interchange protein DsbE